MNFRDTFTSWLRRGGWAIRLIALLQFVLHLWTNAHDTIFRDELYYVAAGQHLSAGYVEYPPFVAWVAALVHATIGDSVFALRLLPALAGALMVLLVADMVAQMGGGLEAQVLAAFAIALGPVFIGSSGLLSMDPFDQFWWTVVAWLMLRMLIRQEPRMWLWLGVAIGLGLLTKLTMGFFVVALLLGLLLSGQRRLLFNRWIIFGGGIALVLLSPYLVWQAQHGFPVLEYTRIYATTGKTFQATPLQYLAQQVVTVNLLALPLWLAGLYHLFFRQWAKPYRAFGWAYIFLYVFFNIQEAKFYWLSPAYPMLFATGAYGLERWIQQKPRWAWLQPTQLWAVIISGLLFVPFSIPILPAQTFIAISDALGGINQVKTENLQSSALPQSYADRYGWHDMALAVKHAYDTLTPQEKAQACVFTSNYGEAGAVDYFGPALGLPRAISGHNSYFIWGPQGCTGQVLITVNVRLQDLQTGVNSVTPAGETSCTYCMPFENHAPIYITRGLKAPIDQLWPQVKSYN